VSHGIPTNGFSPRSEAEVGVRSEANGGGQAREEQGRIPRAAPGLDTAGVRAGPQFSILLASSVSTDLGADLSRFFEGLNQVVQGLLRPRPATIAMS